MVKNLILLSSFVLIASCSSIPSENPKGGWLSDDTVKVDRAKELFACSKFFNIVASERPQNAKKYNELSKQAKDYAFSVMPSYKEGSEEIKSELSNKYTNYANYKSRSWVKEIGSDITGQRFSKITRDCYKTVQRESLFGAINGFSNQNTSSQ